jgi:two-component system sensor histidine kinase AgrC
MALTIMGGFASALCLMKKRVNIPIWLLTFLAAFAVSCLLCGFTGYITSIAIFTAILGLVYFDTKNIFYSVTIGSWALMVVMFADSIVPAVCVLIQKKNITEILFGAKYSYVVYAVFVAAVSVAVSGLLGILFHNGKKITDARFYDRFGKLPALLALCSVALIFINNGVGKSFGFNNEFIVINGFFISVFFITVVSVVIIFLKNMVTQMEYRHSLELNDNLLSYIRDMERVYKDMREFRHDYKNVLFSLSGFINDNDYDSLKRYFNEKIYPLKNAMDENILSAEAMNNIEIREIKGVLAIKQLYAINNSVNFNIHIPYSVKTIKTDIVDFVRIFGILLDNAIEGAKEASNPKIDLLIENTDDGTRIVIENTCKSDAVDLNKIFCNGYSTKNQDGSRGIGLSSLMSILSKYKDVYYDFSCSDGAFRVELMI